jgi:predicted outer membrane protein
MSAFLGAAALAAPPAPEQPTVTDQVKLGNSFSVLHAVSSWSMKLSEMADQRAKSDLVKDYARNVITTNTAADQKLVGVAKRHQLDISPVTRQTEEGNSLLDRMKGETALLGSLQGDAFDKEYMTLVTNTQQSVINMLESKRAMATDPEVKQLLGDMANTVRGRLQTAQDIMKNVYGDSI